MSEVNDYEVQEQQDNFDREQRHAEQQLYESVSHDYSSVWEYNNG